jgi:hypothetical protein
MISIALGMSPDHRYLVEDEMSTKMAMRIKDRCRITSAMPFGTAHDMIRGRWLEEIAERQKEVEIFGSYTNMCVASAVRHGLSLGLTVNVPKSYIVMSSKSSNGLITTLNELNGINITAVPFNYQQDRDTYRIKPSNEPQESYLS